MWMLLWSYQTPLIFMAWLLIPKCVSITDSVQEWAAREATLHCCAAYTGFLCYFRIFSDSEQSPLIAKLFPYSRQHKSQTNAFGKSLSILISGIRSRPLTPHQKQKGCWAPEAHCSGQNNKTTFMWWCSQQLWPYSQPQYGSCQKE